MEQHLPMVSKKFWSIFRVIYYMLRKGIIISKPKILADLNSILKRGKAAIHSLMMFHHHSLDRNEYEFSCSSSPAAFFKRASHALQPIDGNLAATPMVRQLRITDSPFPLRDDDEGSGHVDEAAEEFIMRFYNDLRRQNEMGYLGYS